MGIGIVAFILIILGVIIFYKLLLWIIENLPGVDKEAQKKKDEKWEKEFEKNYGRKPDYY